MKMSTTKLMSLILMFMLLFTAIVTANIPAGPTITSNTTETKNDTTIALLNTTGGSFTTLVLNVTNQNLKWKAYVGNVTGKLTLDDADNNSIYDWSTGTLTGNVYASRNGSIDWGSLNCSQPGTITTEEAAVNINSAKSDSISNTFKNKTHKGFYAANNWIQNKTCPSIATYVNDQAQTQNESALFQEVLLEDSGSNLIYTTVLEDAVLGFDGGLYDFQMIVADDESTAVVTPYYFFVELK